MASALVTSKYKFCANHVVDGEDFLHGHDYELELTFRGSINEETGWILHRDQLDQVVADKILKDYHTANLNLMLEHGTGELAARDIYQRMVATEFGQLLVQVAVQETRKNRFIFRPE